MTITRSPSSTATAVRDADVYVGSCFTAEMADAAEKLRLIHPAAAGTDKVDFDALAGGVIAAAAI